ncbi:MAG: hypothetical protein EBX37_12135 [Alphaproteobacteria bacterium]|nr:hypothetical protein [Alphaproteobacteria bacterium]
MTYEIRTMELHVGKPGDTSFEDGATRVSIDDEAAGEFVKVVQYRSDDQEHVITIDPDEWPTIRKAINRMVAECRP